jgi:hypothetical protein
VNDVLSDHAHGDARNDGGNENETVKNDTCGDESETEETDDESVKSGGDGYCAYDAKSSRRKHPRSCSSCYRKGCGRDPVLNDHHVVSGEYGE